MGEEVVYFFPTGEKKKLLSKWNWIEIVSCKKKFWKFHSWFENRLVQLEEGGGCGSSGKRKHVWTPFFYLFQKFYFKKLGIFLKNQLSELAPQNFKNTFICGNIWEEKRFVDFKPRYGVKSNRFSKKFEISWILLSTFKFSKILNFKNFQFCHHFWRIWIFFDKKYIIWFAEKYWKNFNFDISAKKVFLNLCDPKFCVIFFWTAQ